jgi:hypothetical protein
MKNEAWVMNKGRMALPGVSLLFMWKILPKIVRKVKCPAGVPAPGGFALTGCLPQGIRA